jgi:hypothetical protein
LLPARTDPLERARSITDALDHLLWSCIVAGVPVWRLAGIVRAYSELLEWLARSPEVVEEIRRKRRWEKTPR